MQDISVGRDNFKNLIDENCLFIDKSLFIEEIIQDKNKLKFFLRVTVLLRA